MNRIMTLTATLFFSFSPLLAVVVDETRPIQRQSSLHDISATLSVERPRAEVGMPVELILSVAGEAAPRAIFPSFEENFGIFDVRSVTPLKSDALGSNARAVRIELVGYEAGEHPLPELSIETDGRDLVLDGVDPVMIEVVSLVGPNAGPDEHHDIRKAIPVPLAKSDLGWWILCGALALGAAGLLIWWLLTRKSANEPEEPADLWAERKLDDLEARHLPTSGKVQLFFFELTDITRAFIERRYDIDAPERTTQEFMVEAQRHHGLDPEHAKILGRMLRSADMVKFAGDRPAQNECERSMAFVRRFVHDSGPKPEPTSLQSTTGEHDLMPTAHPERMQSMGLTESMPQETLSGRNTR